MTATDQMPTGNNNHHSRSLLVLVPQSGNVPHFAVIFRNWSQIFSAPRFAIPNFARF